MNHSAKPDSASDANGRDPVVGELVEEDQAKSLLSTLMVLVVGAVMVLYLLNPFLGVGEFLPDNLPIIGNLDEVAATTVLLGCLSYFGIELPWLNRHARSYAQQKARASTKANKRAKV